MDPRPVVKDHVRLVRHKHDQHRKFRKQAEGGFDCSGLTHAASAAADITIPRSADAQYRAGSLLTAGQPLLPGDLVFYGTPSHIHHVGVYIGQGRMVHAPDVGQTIRIAEYGWAGDDFVAAGRPGNLATTIASDACN